MEATKSLDRYFQGLEEKDEFSGVVLITRGDTELYSGAFGYASRAWKIKNTLDVRFDTASITKLFTTVAILQLIDQKRFSPETSAIEFLGLEGTKISKEVNIFHLLTHTSGIGDDCEEEDGEDLRRPVEDETELFCQKHGRFPSAIHSQGTKLPTRAGMPLLQLQFCPVGIDDRKSHRHELS